MIMNGKLQPHTFGITKPCNPVNVVDLINYNYDVLDVRYVKFNKTNDEMTMMRIFNGSRYTFLYSAITSEYVELQHFTNVYVSSNGFLCNETHFISVYGKKPSNDMFYVTDPVAYESVIYPMMPFIKAYGHFFNDAFPYLLQIPTEIVKNSVIIMSYPLEEIVKFAKIVGLPTKNFIVKYNKYIFAHHLYFPHSRDFGGGLNVYSFPYMARKIKEALRLNGIRPDVYALTNRPPGLKRYIQNFDELCKEIIKIFPDITWHIVTIRYTNIKDLAKTLSSFKVWFTPCGSNAINIVYMQPKTYVCLSMSCTGVDRPNFAVAYNSDVWCIGFQNVGFAHHQGGGGKCDIPVALDTMMTLMFLVKHGRWPSMEKFNYVFNKTMTLEKMKRINESIVGRYYYR